MSLTVTAKERDVDSGSRIAAWHLISDRTALVALSAVSVVAIWRILSGGTLVGQDSATQFYPWYSYLGERLSSFEIPAWNPAQFSGAPFAADPQSGWTYLPAMVLFTLMPLSAAVTMFLAFHLLLSAFGAYVLARVTGIGPLGALTTGIAFELSGPVFSRAICCPAQIQVISWVPVVLVGLEMALNRERWTQRLAWIVLAAVAMSQVVASWIGQGSYYVALLAGGWLVYRGVLDPWHRTASLTTRQRLRVTSGVGVAFVVISAGLAAAGVLPRFEFNQLSNLAGGVYQNDHLSASVSGGWQAGNTMYREVTGDPYYPGSVVIALAAVGVLLARGRFASPFFSVVVVALFVMSASVQTPLHTVAYTLLPWFESLHRHWPERVAMIGFIAIAMLAGTTVDRLISWQGKSALLNRIVVLPIALCILFGIGLTLSGDGLPLVVYVGVAVVAAALMLVGRASASSTILPWIPVALVILVTADLVAANGRMIGQGPYGGYHRIEVNRFFQPSNAALFLSGQGEEPFRFAGFDPRISQMAGGWPVFYRYQFAQERTRALIVNNRATLIGLEDIQGYNPVQLQAYVVYFNSINGGPQDYHDANVTFEGLQSPLVDLLNVRFVVVPSAIAEEGVPMFAELVAKYPVVFDDGLVRILERESAFPRAWIVHQAEQASVDEAIKRVAEGEVDPRETVLIDGSVPQLQHAPAGLETVQIVSHEPDRITVQTRSLTAGMLVLSEVAYPSWKATIDGVPVEIATAYGLLRAIPLPAGAHTVVFEYDKQTEYVGIGITLATVALLGCTFAGVAMKRRMEDQRTSVRSAA
ncbi:hypothetical protein BH23CHL5_BH23CHL5_00860 [soil metagenome]